jgi:site-specific recombinase XerD
MVAGGTPLAVVQAHLGHESIITTTSTYLHLDRGSFQKAAQAIGEYLR